MTSKELTDFIETIDKEIKNYTNAFNSSVATFYSDLQNEPFLKYERTLSIITNDIVCKELKKAFVNVTFAASEYAISFKNGITASDYSSLRKEVDLSAAKKWKNYCVVDGYFEISDKSTHQLKRVFVEYKLQHDFVYLDLAIDYLKYKAYTLNRERNTMFVYVIFDKDHTYPTILSNVRPHYGVLSKGISKTAFTWDKRVYVYRPSGEEELPKTPVTSINKTLEMLDNLKNDSLEIEDGSLQDKYSDDDLFVLYSIKNYNSKVIRSSKIQKNYSFAESIWESANKNNVFDKPELFLDMTGKKVEPRTVFEKGFSYTSFLNEFTNNEKKVEAYKNGVRGSNYTSLFLIAFLLYFRKRFNLQSSEPVLTERTIGRGSKKEDVSDNEVIKHYFGQLNEHFSKMSTNDAVKKLKKIGYSTLLFIHKIYPLIYEIDGRGTILGEKKQFRVYKAFDAMTRDIKRITKDLGIKTKIDLERIVYQKDKKELELFNKEIILPLFWKY